MSYLNNKNISQDSSLLLSQFQPSATTLRTRFQEPSSVSAVVRRPLRPLQEHDPQQNYSKIRQVGPSSNTLSTSDKVNGRITDCRIGEFVDVPPAVVSAYNTLSRLNNLDSNSRRYATLSPDRFLSPTEKYGDKTCNIDILNGFGTISDRYQLLTQNYQQRKERYFPGGEDSKYKPVSLQQTVASVSGSRYLENNLMASYNNFNMRHPAATNGTREYPPVSRDYDNLNNDYMGKAYPGTLSRNFPTSRAASDLVSRNTNGVSRDYSPIARNLLNDFSSDINRRFPSSSRDLDDGNVRDYSSSTNNSDILDIAREMGHSGDSPLIREQRIPKDQSLSGFARSFGTIPRDVRISRESLDRPIQSQTPPSRQSQTPPSLHSATPPLRQSQPSPLRPIQTPPSITSNTPPLRPILQNKGMPNQPPSYRDATSNSHNPQRYSMSPKRKYRTAEEYHYDYRGGYRPAESDGDTAGGGGERQPFLSNVEPVRLTPSWEQQTNVTKEELNFKNVNTFETFDTEAAPPRDKLALVFLTFTLHGIGTLMPWNMFITAYPYFIDYKLVDDAGMRTKYANNFLTYVGYASQLPNVLFNWMNVFVQVGGNITTRIVWSILIEVLLFILTVVMAMVDSSAWIEEFFYTTMIVIVLINSANAIFQNTVYGMAARLPAKYTGAVILGSNISGTFTAIIQVIALLLAPNVRTSAIYYFITALFILLACFDTYFALPLNRFFRYHEALYDKSQKAIVRSEGMGKPRVPYFHIFKKSFMQLFNVFMVFFVTLSVFPAVLADTCRTNPNFFISPELFQVITCFLTFNLFAMFGNMLPGLFMLPGPRFLVIPVLLRLFFIPAFLFCHYYPVGADRILPVLIDSDLAYWILNIFMGLTSGYYSSLAMMYCSRSVEPQHAPVAGMMGAASLVTGIFAGICSQMLWPLLVSNVTFDIPGWETTFRNCTKPLEMMAEV